MSAIVVLLVSKLQILHFSIVKSLFLLTSKPPKTQTLIEHEATGVILKPCRAICGYLRPSASVLGRRYPHLIEVCWVMMRLSCGCNLVCWLEPPPPFPRNPFCWLEPPLSHPPRTPQHAPNSPPTASRAFPQCYASHTLI